MGVNPFLRKDKGKNRRKNSIRVKCFLMIFLLLPALTACAPSVQTSVILQETESQADGENASPEETAVTAINTEASTDIHSENSNSPNNDSSIRLVLVGDSRTKNLAAMIYGLDETSDGCIIEPMGSDYVICSGGVGYKWMLEHEKDIDEQAVSGSAIVINMGVNGCEPSSGETADEFAERYSSQYADWINRKAAYWESKGAKTYFCTVNPVDDEKAKKYNYTVRNEYVRRFNEAIALKLNDSVGYIDTYSAIYEILAAGNGTDDGLHYYKYVYEEIKDCIWQTVKEKQ